MDDRSVSIVLSPEQIGLLRQELSRDDLSIYTVVIMGCFPWYSYWAQVHTFCPEPKSSIRLADANQTF